MDGHFVPNIVMGAPIIGSVNKSVPGIFMDCHMMVSEPLKVCLSHSPAVDQIYRGGRWQVPVSYTHLTLPTIYSV